MQTGITARLATSFLRCELHQEVTQAAGPRSSGYTAHMSEAAPILASMPTLPHAPTLARSPRRAAVVLTLILLLHVLLFDWLGDGTTLRGGLNPRTENVITLMLGIKSPKAIAASAAALPAVVRPTRKKVASITRPKSIEPPPLPAEPEIVAQADQLPDVVDKSMSETEPPPPIPPTVTETASITQIPTGEQVDERQGAQMQAQLGGTPSDPAPPSVEKTPAVPTRALAETATPVSTQATGRDGMLYAPLPSAQVSYDVQALRDGKTVFGSGKISWRSQGDAYVIDGEAGVLFFSVLTFRSEGRLDRDGITPVKYSEKRFRNAETNTHFRQDPQVISFSASTAQYPRKGGEQDRASIIWQLAAIGHGDPAQFQSGKTLQVFVAGVRDGEVWSIAVLGQESIEVGGSKLNAWHLQRLPRTGSFDTQVDIWLAPSRDWYPVKLRQTERNGDFLDMAMSKITPL